jgi:hypothetical protein
LVRICLSTGRKPRSSTTTPAVEGGGGGFPGALHRDQQALVPRLDGGHLGPQVDAGVGLRDPLVQRLDQVLVGARDDLVHQLDDGDLGAQLVVHRRHLQPDDPAAEDEQPARHLLELERAGGVQDPRVVVRDERQPDRLGAGRDDRVLEVDRGGTAVGQVDLHLVR